MVGIWISIFLIIPILNTVIDKFLTPYSLIINDININKASVIIAPIVEEILKFMSYFIIFLVDFNKIFDLGYNSKKEFINDNIGIIFILSVGAFGLQEGMSHNTSYPIVYLWAFWILNSLIHITYSAYPFLFGKKYNNSFLFFLPIGMLLHSVHNFIIDHLWDNKWVTFSMVVIFLLPLVFLERSNIVGIFRKGNPKKVKVVLAIISIVIFIYIFLSLFFAF